MEIISNKKTRAESYCEKLLYALILTLVFEGIVRKFIPALKTPVFFLKDVLCVIGIFKINSTRLPLDMVKFRSVWLTLFYLFLPLLFFTAWKDVILAFFAAKQYLLYLVTVILAIVAFPVEKEGRFRRFLFFCSLLLVPTIIVAIIQNALPASHWLNRSVGGESLAGFSAAGRLRVGSTFSFTAQYSWFITAEVFLVASSFFLPPSFNNRLIKKLMPLAYFTLIIMLVVSAFITGGRTAVLGCGSTLVLGAVFIGVKRPAWFISKGLPTLFIGIFGLLLIRQIKPEYFAAYDARSKGTSRRSHNEEVEGRLIDGFTDWTKWFWDQNSTAIVFGNGLGVMSNGSNQVSSYASEMREKSGWTEGDVPTTFWEGGFYLGIVWYGLRLSMILLCTRLWWSMKKLKLVSAASIPLAYVIVQGITGTLAMQPPVAIWWWLAIGVMFFLYRFENNLPVGVSPVSAPTIL